MARILVIDDEPKIVSFVSRALASHGFSVDSATDGDQGLRSIRSGAYDLVVLDLMLPQRSGLAVLREAMQACPTQRVLVLSAVADVECKVRCLELGAVDYLSKPFSVAELTSRVRARLREQAAPPTSRQLRASGLVLDLDRRVAVAGERRIALSPREFVLLEYLMRNAGKACSRDELLERVWGYTFDPSTNVVDVYVARLRSKLGSRAIETIRNVGYCVEAA